MVSIRSGQIQYFTQDELKRFFRIIEKTPSRRQARDLALFHFMYLLGARASEIGTLRRDDIKDSTGEVVLRRLKGSWFTTIRLDKPRLKVLRAWLNDRPGQHPTDPLFPSQKAGKEGELQGIKRSAIYRLTARYWAAAGIAPDKCHPHIFKHSIAVHMAESGVWIKEVQDFLWHKSINNTLIYFQMTSAHKEAFYNKIQTSNYIVWI